MFNKALKTVALSLGLLFFYTPITFAATPTVSSSAASSITSTGATLSGSISDTGGSNPSTRGFEYGLTTSYGKYAFSSGSFSAGSFSATLSDIACNTTYHFRAYAINSDGSASSSDRTFTTSNSDSSCGKVTYTYDNKGIQTIKYNGQSYTSSPTNDVYVTGAMFQTPGGVEKPYGWYSDSLGSLALFSATKSTGSNPDYSQQIYRSGQSDSFTVKMSFSSTDSSTLKITTDVTNNDSTDTLTKINLEYFLFFTVPGPVLREIPYLGYNLAFGGSHNASPTGYLSGDWGSVVMYTDNYTNNWLTTTATNYSNSDGSKTFIVDITNNSTLGTSTNIVSEPIGPGQTSSHTFYIRFGDSSQTSSSLAPEAYTAYRSALPYLVNWPNRAPVARWFIAEGYHTSSSNPRGYLWDTSLNVSDQSAFNTRILTLADQMVTRMNAMNPKPQAIAIWDLEGEEFYQYFTYVGSPDKIAALAPEMDAVADQLLAKFTNAGYNIALTLRPSDFQVGPSSALPTTCFSSSSNVDLDDIYIASDGTYPYRGYTCSSTNTWRNDLPRWPYHQHSPQDDATLLSNLETKVAYARNRWGVKMYYIDSTVYSTNSGGSSMNAKVFRQLQADFPDCIFFPENESNPYYGASAPYNQVDQGYTGVPSEVLNIYPNAFTILAHATYYANSLRSTLVQSVKDGNILYYEGSWFMTDTNTASIYLDAGYSSAPSITFESPANSSTASGVVALTASSSSYLNSGITGVRFVLDNTSDLSGLITSTSSPYNYTYSWDSRSISNGSHTISAVSADAIGNYATSTITVSVNNVYPSIISAVRDSDTQITVTLDSSVDPSTITKSNDGGFSVTDSETPSTSYTISSIAPGADNTKIVMTVSNMSGSINKGVTVKYTASGNGTIATVDGNAMQTNSTGIIIPPWDTTKPIISSVTSSKSSGAYGLGTSINISLAFSKNINTTGTVTVTLNSGGSCTISGVTNLSSASCNYIVGVGDIASTLNVSSVSGTITDTMGNSMTNFSPLLNLSSSKTISVDAVSPYISVDSPTNGSTVAGSIDLSATAIDSNDDMAGVQFVLDNTTNIGSEDTTSPYSVTWDSTGITSYGSHTISAVARDSVGNLATSTVTVTVDNVAPVMTAAIRNSDTQITVYFSKNLTDSTVNKSNSGGFTVKKTGLSTSYSVSAIAMGTTSNQVILTTANTSAANASGLTITYSASGNGTVADYLGNLMATDSTGVNTGSWTDNPPVISDVTSSNPDGSYKEGDDLTIQFTFSSNITSTGSVSVIFNTGGTCSFTVTNSSSATCTYTIGSNQNTSDLNVIDVSGTIANGNNTAMTAFTPTTNLSANKDIVVDTFEPSISSVVPADHYTVYGNVTLSANVTDAVGVTNVKFLLDGTDLITSLSSPVSGNSYSTTWDSTAITEQETHSIYVVARDAVGNYSTSTVSVIVQNANPDMSAPYIIASSPSGSTYLSSENTTLSITTDELASCKYSESPRIAYDDMPSNMDTIDNIVHTGTLRGLKSGNSYSYYVRCTDFAGNSDTSDYEVSFRASQPNSIGGGGGVSYRAPSTPDINQNNTAAKDITSAVNTSSVSVGSLVITLYKGNTSTEIKKLQIFLNSIGFNVASTGPGSPGHETSFFGAATSKAVSKFQEFYFAEILKPQGLKSGTGNVGPATLKKINEIINKKTPTLTQPKKTGV